MKVTDRHPVPQCVEISPGTSLSLVVEYSRNIQEKTVVYRVLGGKTGFPEPILIKWIVFEIGTKTSE